MRRSCQEKIDTNKKIVSLIADKSKNPTIISSQLMNLWSSIKENYTTYLALTEQFGLSQDISQYIAYFWMSLDYKSTFEDPREIFSRRLLNASIRLTNRIKQWKCLPYGKFTQDKKYYIAHTYKNKINYIHIYNPKTQELVIEIPYYKQYKLLTKNILLLPGNDKRPAILYDIEKKASYTLWHKKLIRISLSKDENYCAGWDGLQILLFNISDITSVSCVSSEYTSVRELAISSDNSLVAVSSYYDNSIILWKVEEGILKNRAKYNQKNVAGDKLRFFENDQYLITTCAIRAEEFCCNLKLTQEDQSIAIKEEFYWENTTPYWYWKTLTKTKLSDKIFISANRSTNTLSISTILGEIIYLALNINPWRIALSEDEHLIVATHTGSKTTTILRLFYDNQNNRIKVQRKDFSHYDGSIKINSLSNLILLDGFDKTGWHDKVFLYDIDGNKLKSWRGKDYSFHPNGRSVLIEDKKHTLFPSKLDEHCKKISASPTLAQYYFFKKICEA